MAEGRDLTMLPSTSGCFTTGVDYPGDDYPGDDYPGDDYPGVDYPGVDYPGVSQYQQQEPDPRPLQSIGAIPYFLQRAYDINVQLDELRHQYTDVFAPFIKTQEENGHILLDADQFLKYGMEHLFKGRNAEAIDMYTRAIHLRPTDSLLYCYRAHANHNLGNYYLVFADCNTAIQLDPSCATAYSELGSTYYKLEMYQESVESFQKAIDLGAAKPGCQICLKYAFTRLLSSIWGDQFPTSQMIDVDEILQNRDKLNLAIHMITEPAVRNVVNKVLYMEETGNSSLLDMSMEVVMQLIKAKPDFLNNVRRQRTKRPWDSNDEDEDDDEDEDEDESGPSNKRKC